MKNIGLKNKSEVSFKSALTLSVLLGLSACQKNQSTSQEGQSGQSADATTVQKACLDTNNISDVQVSGAQVAQVGQTVTYQLNKSVCNDTQKLNWDIGGSKTVNDTTTNKVSSAFIAPGRYVISAQIPQNKPVQKTGATQKSGGLFSLQQSLQTSASVTQQTVVIGLSPQVLGNQVVLINTDETYQIALPDGMTVKSATWDFGDGTPVVNNTSSVIHKYTKIGQPVMKVSITDTTGVVFNLSQTINVMVDSTQQACAKQVAISSPTLASLNVAINISGFIPDCLKGDVTGINLNVGDGSAVIQSTTTSHAYSKVGFYQITFDVNSFFQEDLTRPYIRLTQTVQVIDPKQNCPRLGDQRTLDGEMTSSSAVCGLDGSKTQNFVTRMTQECQSVEGILSWVEVSRQQVLVSESQCTGQSCRLADQSILKDGQSRVMYSSSTPVGTCDLSSQTRVCQNGVLSGSADYVSLTCKNGCGVDFGSDGTVKTGVVVGEIKSALTCSFNEPNLFKTYSQIADKKCVDGTIVTSNTRQGDLIQSDRCPLYSWKATEEWTKCSADCGGQQSQIFVCQSDSGVVVGDERCSGAKPVVGRVCDGNPEAVAKTESSTATEEAPSSAKCPKNQIGVILNTRTVTTTKVSACIDHSVQVVSTNVTASAWVEEKYCRDFVAHRCSQDSLSNDLARGRHDWMVKCQNEVPVIKEFLENFEDIKSANGGFTIGTTKRLLYPTFMVRGLDGKEKPWIAPTKKTAECKIPEGAYIAAVCLSSCATPEQEILVEARDHQKQSMTFLDALTQNAPKVLTLAGENGLSTQKLKVMPVDQWVTELIDTNHEILVFKMKSGGSIKLTPNHPIVTDEGAIKLAENFKVGEKLVKLGGQLDPIVSITKVNYFGKVYNVFVKSAAPVNNIVITNGYLNGTAFFQNEGAENVNRVVLRKRITRGVFNP